MILPGDFRKVNFDTHDTRERALDFHVKAGEDWNPALVIVVLIRVPRIPATAQVIAGGCGLRFGFGVGLGLGFGLGLCCRHPSQQQ